MVVSWICNIFAGIIPTTTKTMVNSFFTTSLLHWYKEHGRNLPWRETKDPYAIWLSEIILQQTRIQQGWAYWERFMKRWPTVEALAAATEDEVLREWQGLGYYSRARNLHAAARQIVAIGGFPQTLEEIRKLKGVGDYTAAAIASFAFGIPAAVVDGNVYRVLSRYFGIDTPINTTEGKKVFAALAQEVFPWEKGEGREKGNEGKGEREKENEGKGERGNEGTIGAQYNQAIMDFGAMQCTPKTPKCESCPLVESCEALRTGRVEVLPIKEKKLQVKTRHITYVYIRCNGETAIHRRGAGDIWQGLWEPLLLNEECRMKNEESAGAWRDDNCQLSIINCQLLQRNVKHVLTHRVILADFYLMETEVKPELPEGYIWIREEDIDNYGIPRLVEKLLEKVKE